MRLPLVVRCETDHTEIDVVLFQGRKFLDLRSGPVSNAESRYAHTERQILAAVLAMEKFHDCIFGRKKD